MQSGASVPIFDLTETIGCWRTADRRRSHFVCTLENVVSSRTKVNRTVLTFVAERHRGDRFGACQLKEVVAQLL